MPEQDRVVQMPDAEVMVRKLRETGLYGLAPQSDRLYDRFIGEVAGTRKTGMGLNNVWELSKFDTVSDFPIGFHLALEVNYETILNAITPDPAVVADALEARRQVWEALQQSSVNDPSQS